MDSATGAAKRPWITFAPSALSILRIAMAALFPVVPGGWRVCVVLVAGVSDMTDGLCARRLGVASWAGGHLDALTDKIFAVAALATLLVAGVVTPWQVGLLLCRDVVVAVIAAYVTLRRRWAAFRHTPARLLGKLTTASMFVLFLAIVIWPPQSVVVWLLLAGTGFLSVVAAIDYLSHFVRRLRGLNPVSSTGKPGG
jgi:cardiolipin synthase